MAETPDPQDEGSADRIFYGIDGTMGDAQDVTHPFVGSVHGTWCSICGLAKVARCHRRYDPLASLPVPGA